MLFLLYKIVQSSRQVKPYVGEICLPLRGTNEEAATEDRISSDTPSMTLTYATGIYSLSLNSQQGMGKERYGTPCSCEESWGLPGERVKMGEPGT